MTEVGEEKREREVNEMYMVINLLTILEDLDLN